MKTLGLFYRSIQFQVVLRKQINFLLKIFSLEKCVCFSQFFFQYLEQLLTELKLRVITLVFQVLTFHLTTLPKINNFTFQLLHNRLLHSLLHLD